MIEFSWVHLGFLMLAGFVGSFIDAIVGGGGLITLPAWMATGLPMAYALGSNKMASVVGAITSFTTFMRSGRVDRRMLRYMPLSVIGSVLGAVIASSLPEMLLRYIVIAALVIVALYTFFKKEWGGADQIASFSTKDLAGILFMILFWAPMMDFWTGDRNLPDFWFSLFRLQFCDSSRQRQGHESCEQFRWDCGFSLSRQGLFHLCHSHGPL